MCGVVVRVACQHGPKDASIFVGHGDDGFLPADALMQVAQPHGDAVAAFGGAEQGGLGALDEQGAQVVIAAFGNAPQAVFATGRILTGNQAEPGSKLARGIELAHVADSGDEGGSGEFANTAELRGATRLVVLTSMLFDALVAPIDLFVELTPLKLGLLQAEANDAGHLVAGVFKHVAEDPAKGVGGLSDVNAELSEQAADAVDASRAVFLVALAQTVDALLGLLLGGLDGDEAHVRPVSGFADGSSVVGVVLAAGALHAIGGNELTGDQSGIQPHQAQTACDVVSAAATLHGHNAAGGQGSGPFEEPSRRHGTRQYSVTSAADGMDLVNTLGQIEANSGNLVHGLPPSNGSRLMT